MSAAKPSISLPGDTDDVLAVLISPVEVVCCDYGCISPEKNPPHSQGRAPSPPRDRMLKGDSVHLCKHQ